MTPEIKKAIADYCIKEYDPRYSGSDTWIKPATFGYQLAEKEIIGKACANLIHPNQTVIIDAGTTTYHVAKFLEPKSPQIIIATEAGMLHRLQKECPGKQFIPAPTDNCRCNECRFMKMNTLEKLRDCMANLAPRVELDDEILRRARRPIERMLEISARPQQR